MKHDMNHTLQNITRQANLEKILYLPHLFTEFRGWRKGVIDALIVRFRFGLQTIISQEELARIAGVSRKSINEFMATLNDIGFLQSIMRYDGKYDGQHRFQYNRYVLNPAFMTAQGREVWFLLFGCMDHWPTEEHFSLCYVTSNYNNLCPQEADSSETELNYPSTGRPQAKKQRTLTHWPEVWWEFLHKPPEGPPNNPMDEIEAQLIFGSS
jgi:hypothetical protein